MLGVFSCVYCTWKRFAVENFGPKYLLSPTEHEERQVIIFALLLSVSSEPTRLSHRLRPASEGIRALTPMTSSQHSIQHLTANSARYSSSAVERSCRWSLSWPSLKLLVWRGLNWTGVHAQASSDSFARPFGVCSGCLGQRSPTKQFIYNYNNAASRCKRKPEYVINSCRENGSISR